MFLPSAMARLRFDLLEGLEDQHLAQVDGLALARWGSSMPMALRPGHDGDARQEMALVERADVRPASDIDARLDVMPGAGSSSGRPG